MVACGLDDLPSAYSRKVISEIIQEEDYLECQVAITPGAGEGDNRLGEVIKIKLSGTRKDGSQISTDLVLKVSPAGQSLRDLAPVNWLYVKEAYAYNVLFPRFESLQEEFNIPKENRFQFVKCFKTSSKEYEEYIVMEDLTTQGFKMFDRLDSFDLDHLELSIKNLATIHSFSFVIKARDPGLFAELASHASDSVDFGSYLQGLVERSFEEAILVMDDTICVEKLRQFSIGLYDKYCQCVDSTFAAPYNVICHGDSWTNNFLFKYEDGKLIDMRTLDWQILRNASPVTDLAYMIFLSTDEKLRAEHFYPALDLYYETLRVKLSAMGQDIDICYPEKVFRDHVKKILPYGLLFSLFALPIIMSGRDNPPDLVEMMKYSAAIKKETFSESCVERLRGVARDFIKYEII